MEVIVEYWEEGGEGYSGRKISEEKIDIEPTVWNFLDEFLKRHKSTGNLVEMKFTIQTLGNYRLGWMGGGVTCFEFEDLILEEMKNGSYVAISVRKPWKRRNWTTVIASTSKQRLVLTPEQLKTIYIWEFIEMLEK